MNIYSNPINIASKFMKGGKVYQFGKHLSDVENMRKKNAEWKWN